MDTLPTPPRHRVTAIAGDGIGPEVMRATQQVLREAGARIEWEDAMAGAEAFRKGIGSGAPQETLDSIGRNGVALKGPLETPVGFGEKSANVTLRKVFEMYGNIRPVREIPGIRTPFAGRGIDFVVVRENVEDLYAGVEHMQTPGVAQCLKIISEVGCERIVELAASLAAAEGRRKITGTTGTTGIYDEVELGDLRVKYNKTSQTSGVINNVFDVYPWLQSYLGAYSIGGAANTAVRLYRG